MKTTKKATKKATKRPRLAKKNIPTESKTLSGSILDDILKEVKDKTVKPKTSSSKKDPYKDAQPGDIIETETFSNGKVRSIKAVRLGDLKKNAIFFTIGHNDVNMMNTKVQEKGAEEYPETVVFIFES